MNSETISANHHKALVYHHGTSHLKVNKRGKFLTKIPWRLDYKHNPNSGQLITDSFKKLTSGRVQFAGHNTLANYSGDLKSQLVWYSDHGDLFDHQMVCYLDAQYHGSLVFRSQFG